MHSPIRSDVTSASKFAALFLTVSLAAQEVAVESAFGQNSGVGEITRAPNPSLLHTPKSFISAEHSPPCNGESLDAPTGQKFRVYSSLADVDPSMRVLQAGAYNRRLVERITDVLDRVVKLDQSEAGLTAEDLTKFSSEMNVLCQASSEAKKIAGALFPEKENIFSTAELNSAIAVISLSYKSQDLSKAVESPSGKMSKLGSDMAIMRDDLTKTFLTSQGADAQFRAQGDWQPEMVLMVPWADAVAASKNGEISSSLTEFVPAHLSDKGPTYAMLGLCATDDFNDRNWQKCYGIIGAANVDSAHVFSTVATPFESRSIFIQLQDNSLIHIEQHGCELKFLKNSSGYAEQKVSVEFFGAGGESKFRAQIFMPKLIPLRLWLTSEMTGNESYAK